MFHFISASSEFRRPTMKRVSFPIHPTAQQISPPIFLSVTASAAAAAASIAAAAAAAKLRQKKED